MEETDTEAVASHADIVDSMAYVAQNLAGGSKRQLRLAALVSKAGAKILSKRAGESPAQANQRVEALPRNVERLEREGREKDARIAELERQLDGLRDFSRSLREKEQEGPPLDGRSCSAEKAPRPGPPARQWPPQDDCL